MPDALKRIRFTCFHNAGSPILDLKNRDSHSHLSGSVIVCVKRGKFFFDEIVPHRLNWGTCHGVFGSLMTATD